MPIWLLLLGNASVAATLTLTFATNVISEAAGPGATTAKVSLDAPLTNSVQVLLRGAVDTTKIYVPAAFPLIIPAGSNSIAFSIDAYNNGDLDGSKLVTLTVGADLFANTSATLLVTDDDTPTHRTIGGRGLGTISGTNDYDVIDNLTVPPGQTLTLLPSSRLLFGAGKGLTCNGNLIANGGPGREIIFTRSPSNANWNGINVANSTAKSVFNHVEIAYANANGGISVTAQTSSSPLVVSNSSIHDCIGNGVSVTSWDGIDILPSAVQVVANKIYANGGSGIVLACLASQCNSSQNSSMVIGNEIYNNTHSGVFMDASVYFNGCSATRYCTVDGKIDGNYIHGNGEGITCFADTGQGSGANHVRLLASVIQNNVILNNAANGIAVTGATYQSLQPKIINNTIAGNGNAGIYHVNSQVGFTIENNLLTLNNRGIQAQNPFNGLNVVVAGNDLWGNFISNWVNYPAAYGTLMTTNVNGTGADTNLNISADPLTATGTDFHLQAGSPAVDAGTTNLAPTKDFDGNSRRGRPDIGSYEFSSLLLTPGPLTNGGAFGVFVTGGRGTAFTMESSTNLATWVPVTNGMLTNRTLWLPMPSTTARQAFYRGHLQ